MWASLDSAKPTEQLRLALELLANLERTFSLDAKRLYVAGQSMGGFGTWSLFRMPKYTEYKGADHGIWDTVFNEPDLLAWVFAQNEKGPALTR